MKTLCSNYGYQSRAGVLYLSAAAAHDKSEPKSSSKLHHTSCNIFTMSHPLAALGDARAYRVMHLHAGSGDDTIRFSLQITNCETEPQVHYEALSYAWGDTTKTHEIFCQDDLTSLKVTLNCYDALSSLRLPSRSRTLWIDAICINQEDLDERRAQVAIMKFIYSSACQVVVYLGESSDGSDSVMQYLQDNYEPSQYPRRSTIVPYPSEDAWADFSERPWFSRVWVLQEVFRKQSIELRCGTQSISWDVLNHYHRWRGYLRLHDRKKSALYHTMYFLQETGVRKSRYSTPTAIEMVSKASSLQGAGQAKAMSAMLLQLLKMTREFRSSDPRDKIYGILSILATLQELPLPLHDLSFLTSDYRRSVDELFTDVALFLYTEIGPDVFRHASGVRRGADSQSLPSWVPDWTCEGFDGPKRGRVEPPFFDEDYNPLETFQGLTAGVDPITTAWPREHLALGPDDLNRRLRVQALYLGSLTAISDECDLDQDLFPLSQWKTIALGPTTSETFTSSESTPTATAGSPAQRGQQFQMLLTNDHVHNMADLSGVLNSLLEWEQGKGATSLTKFFDTFVNTSWQVQARRIWKCCDKRRLGVLDNGMIGLVPVLARTEDCVFLVPGASVPFLFRKCGGDLRFVGECFVQGVMYGEAWHGVTVDALQTLTIA